jgi:excinuclease UvrABC nuclease subunit
MPKGRILRKGLRWEKNDRDLDNVPKKPGVYVLHYRDRLVYVGESDDLNRTLNQQADEQNFDEFTWYVTTPQYRFELEKKLIKRYKPPRND